MPEEQTSPRAYGRSPVATMQSLFLGKETRRERWQKAPVIVAHILSCETGETNRMRQLAASAENALRETFPLQDRLAAETCPFCREICCLKSMIDYTWRDLVFLQALGFEPPSQRLRRKDRGHCRNMGKTGCRLSRVQRPFLCNYWLCEGMTGRLQAEPYAIRRAFREALTFANRQLDTMAGAFLDLARSKCKSLTGLTRERFKLLHEI